MKMSLHCSSAVAQWKRPRLSVAHSVTQATSPSPLQGACRHFRSHKKGGTGTEGAQRNKKQGNVHKGKGR